MQPSNKATLEVTLVMGERARHALERLLRMRLVLEDLADELPWREELKELIDDASELSGLMLEMRGRDQGG